MASTTTVGLLSSTKDHAMVLSAMKASYPCSSSAPSCSCRVSSPSIPFRPRRIAAARTVSCQVATSSPDSPSSSPASDEDETGGAKIGARVRVTAPLKVYHVAKSPEIDITGMEGTLKQYVGLWKGKKISANLPFKVEFVTEVEGRGAVKFFVHLRDDEFEYV